MKKYTISNRPYGHGYLAAAYAGYLANGGGDVTSENIAAGMDKIFDDLINGKKFAAALKDNTGWTEGNIKYAFKNGDAGLVEFVRKLSYASKDGAGSIITPSLSDGAKAMLKGLSNTNSPVRGPGINPPAGEYNDGSKVIALQVGADSGQHIDLQLYRMDTAALGLENTNVETQESASDAINEIKDAIARVSSVRSSYGAIQNRLEHTIANLDNIIENITSSESLIRDTDIAKEMVIHSNNQILLQAGQAVLSQANHSSDMILSLLG